MTKASSIGRVYAVGISIVLASCICVAGSSNRAQSDPGPNSILFARHAVDPVATPLASEPRLQRLDRSRSVTRIVQFDGPIQRRSVEAIRTSGARIVGYIPNNAYVVRANADELTAIEELRSTASVSVRWIGEWPAILKVDAEISDEDLARGGGTRRVEVELIDSAEAEPAESYIFSIATQFNAAPRRFLNFLVLDVTLPLSAVTDVAAFDEVLSIKTVRSHVLNDERSAQIVAGNLTPDQTQPVGPGYLDWLASQHLNVQPDFLIDISDSGIDRGITSFVHPDFVDDAQKSRLAYVSNYTDRSLSDDSRGHGTLVASIACGYKMSGQQDELGYFLGVGISPWNRFGSSKIFEDNGLLGFRVSFTQVASAAYSGGARISNNSWGRSGNSYDAASQEFDSLVRDAQPTVPGNQQMIFVFSAGNLGPGGTISSPGTAKNVITTGGSENYRPVGSDRCDMDGQGGVGPDGADNAQELLRYSSGGPTADGRSKPDLVAPATHIQGAISRSDRFFGEGLCAGLWPLNQTLYTWSSGTSLAAPHVTGSAALLREFFMARKLLGEGQPPSPAMVKAFLTNSATYMASENAGGTLPDSRQGWGLVDLGRSFDSTKRILVDQTTLFTDSGQKMEIRGSLADRSQPLRVTLAWTDAPGGIAVAPWVNDLDLEVVVGGARIYRGNHFMGPDSVADGVADTRNNVESVILLPSMIPEGVDGNLTVTVRATNIAGDGVPGNGSMTDQDFALVISNVAAPVEPPPVPVIAVAAYSKKTLTIAGRNFSASARVEINGRLVDRELSFDAASNSLSVGAKPRKLGLIVDAENQIVVIQDGRRSAPFLLRL